MVGYRWSYIHYVALFSISKWTKHYWIIKLVLFSVLRSNVCLVCIHCNNRGEETDNQRHIGQLVMLRFTENEMNMKLELRILTGIRASLNRLPETGWFL